MMSLWDMQQDIRKANETLRNADCVAGELATMLPGRLKHVSIDTLTKLKKELRGFNMHTGEWMR